MSAFDAAWMMKRFAAGVDPLELLKEREAIYLLLPNIMIEKNYASYTIDPTTRYLAIALKGLVPHVDVTTLYDNGTDPIQGIKQDVSVKEPAPSHVQVTSLVTSNQDSTSDNSETCPPAKAQTSVVKDYEVVPSDNTSHHPQ